MQFDTVDEILDFAIEREESAARFYASMAKEADRPGMREAFLEFAAEEGRHKAHLMKIKAGGLPATFTDERVQNLKIADHLQIPPVHPNMTYAEALQIAMSTEKAAFKLYTDLAALTDDASLKEIFKSLAQEEAKHKLRFEIEYEDHVLEGN